MPALVKIICFLIIVSHCATATAQEIVIGCYIPMTGSAAAMGQVVWKGLEVAQRLRPQVLGKNVKLVLLDTKSDRIEAANAVSRLIEKDRVVAIIGEVISGNTLAGAPIAERFGIPNITPTATSPLITQNRPHAFRACFVDTLQGRVAARFAQEHLKAQKVAVIIDQAQDYCVGLAAFFIQEFKKRGGQIVAQTYIQTGDQDFSAQISAIKPKKPDVIYAPNYYAENALLARQMQELGLNVPILTGDGAQVIDLVKIGGPAVEGMYFTAHFHREAVNTPLAQEFIQAYEAETKREVDAFAALAADCYFLLLSALEQAQATEGAKVRQALAATKDFPGVSGTLTMGPDNNPIKEVMILKVQDGTFAFVTNMAP
ncbi:MAG: ABC transporter substrate-binding protein [Deltaproteobacteria bacterium]|nr:ABC transporter substrate-binding protein [Deltaproteobacteria bacterium]